MGASTAVSFRVSDVKRAVGPLDELPYLEAVEDLVYGGRFWSRARVERAAGRAARTAPHRLEACSRYHGTLVGGVEFHPVVAAAHRAFDDHRPLVLSPDMIWLMICQGVANHVRANSERLRPRIVSHTGEVTIAVRRDDFVKGSPENPWAEVFDEFSAAIREHVGPAIDAFIPAFTTTGPAERAAAEVVLLSAMSSYFSCRLGSYCGIPEITLEGTDEDWDVIGSRAECFAGYGLERWVEMLRPILGQFAQARRGNVDRDFWRSFYKPNDASGGPYVDGWIRVFFPYTRNLAGGPGPLVLPEFFGDSAGVAPDWFNRDDPARWRHRLLLMEIPAGMSRANFDWDHLGTVHPMEFLGGFVGVAQSPDTLALRPEIGWAVRPNRLAN